jgi:hypothetical protein
MTDRNRLIAVVDLNLVNLINTPKADVQLGLGGLSGHDALTSSSYFLDAFRRTPLFVR